MPLRIHCPDCGLVMTALDGSRGRQVCCLCCATVFTAPVQGECIGPWQVQVSANQLDWPQKCACCGAKPPDASLQLALAKGRKGREQVRGWPVPYCTRCLAHATESIRAFRAGEPLDTAKAMLVFGCAKLEPAVVYEARYRTVHTIAFYHPQYYRSFVAANQKKCLGQPFPGSDGSDS